jgi:hypothetical protein
MINHFGIVAEANGWRQGSVLTMEDAENTEQKVKTAHSR